MSKRNIWKFGLFVVILILIPFNSLETHAQRRDIRNDIVYPGGPTYEAVVRGFFEMYIFPASLKYEGVGVSRDNVIVEKIERNGNNFWLTVRARYSGNIVGVGVAERAYVHYDNGHVRLDIGGLKGLINTQAIANYVFNDLLPQLDGAVNGTFDKLNIKNKCNRNIWVAIHYKNLNDVWTTEGWWNLDPGEENYVADTRNRIYYVYAESDDTQSNRLYWAGEDIYLTVRNSDKRYGFRKGRITTDQWGKWTYNFTCS